MSAAEMKNLENELDMLSYAEQLAVIEYLVKRMRRQTENQSDEFEGEPNEETLAAAEEIREMQRNPELGKSYTDVDQMMQELLA